ncbi:MAG: hypothetical protein ACRD2N_08725 [Vicinamibacterales bacterium]
MRFALCGAGLALVLFNPALLGQADRSTLRSAGGGQPSVAELSDGRTLVVFAHQDDDLLWMLPFWPVADTFLLAAYPAAPMFEELVKSFPPRLKYRARWKAIWNSVDNDIWAEVFTDRCKRAPIITLATVKAHLRPFLAPPIRRVVTHNNWGEYGHAQHRLVNIAVRQLAVEAGLDVWSLATRMPPEAREQPQYVNVAVQLGLPTIEGFFDPNLFRELRAVYLAHIPEASTPELTAKFRSWWPTLWTWSDQPEAFPMGWRPFVKLVEMGVDLTVGNPAMRRLEDDVAIVNDCPTNPTLPKP